MVPDAVLWILLASLFLLLLVIAPLNAPEFEFRVLFIAVDLDNPPDFCVSDHSMVIKFVAGLG